MKTKIIFKYLNLYVNGRYVSYGDIPDIEKLVESGKVILILENELTELIEKAWQYDSL